MPTYFFEKVGKQSLRKHPWNAVSDHHHIDAWVGGDTVYSSKFNTEARFVYLIQAAVDISDDKYNAIHSPDSDVIVLSFEPVSYTHLRAHET